MTRGVRVAIGTWLLFAATLAACGGPTSGGDFPASAADAPVLSTPDPSWSVSTLDGHSVTLESLRGRVVFLNVWATWCPPCVQEMPSIQALADAFADTDVAFVAASHEDPVVIERFARAHDYDLPFHRLVAPLPAGLDGGGVVPVTFVLDREGRLRFRHVGFRDWSAPESRDFLRGLRDA